VIPIPWKFGLSRRLSRGNDRREESTPARRRLRATRPIAENLEQRNLPSHTSVTAATGITAALDLPAPDRFYGLGRPRHVLLRQVPVDLGAGPYVPPSLGSYTGIALNKGPNTPKGGSLELFLGQTVEASLISGSVEGNHSDFVTYTGTPVPQYFPGRVVRVVKNWKPQSRDPNGNEVVVRTVEPNGLVFYIRYSHLLPDIKLKVGQYLPWPSLDVGRVGQGATVGRAGHTGVPANQSTTYSVTAWTPQFGGRYLHFAAHMVIAPESFGGIPPDFVDLDPNPDGSSDDPDTDVDDPNGFFVVPTPP